MPTRDHALPVANIRSPGEVTLSVWKALFLREAATRLASGRAAWMWLLFEPVAEIAVLMVVFTVIRGRSYPGVDFALFLAIGVIGFAAFRNAAMRSIDAISSNAALFAYRQVKPVDTVIVRAVLEGVLLCLVAAILMGCSSLIGLDVLPHNPVNVAISLTVLWALGTGFGLVLSVGAELVPEIGKVARIVMTPIYFLSGVLFSPQALPPSLRDWLLLNPLMHGIEFAREAFFPSYPPLTGISILYPAACALLALLLGLALHVRFTRRLVEL